MKWWYKMLERISDRPQINCVVWHNGAKSVAIIDNMATQDVECFVRWDGFDVVVGDGFSQTYNVGVNISSSTKDKG